MLQISSSSIGYSNGNSVPTSTTPLYVIIIVCFQEYTIHRSITATILQVIFNDTLPQPSIRVLGTYSSATDPRFGQV